MRSDAAFAIAIVNTVVLLTVLWSTCTMPQLRWLWLWQLWRKTLIPLPLI